MSEKTSQQKYCNCQKSSNKEILKSNISNSFCKKCGTILLKSSDGNICYPLHQKQKKKFIDFNPIEIIKSMKEKTEKDYPNIYNLYNLPNFTDETKANKPMRAINMYLRYRSSLIVNLQKMMKTFDYCDIVFYQTLFYLDTYLSHDMTLEMSEKSIFYYLVGYFLISLKSKENDIYEPSFDSFYDIEKGMFLSPSKIALYEVICLKRIKYNIFSYSSYDWVMQLIAIGIVFNSEVDNTNEIILIKGHRHSLINTINKSVIKILLNITIKEAFFKYSPMHVAFSVIQLTREKYIKESMIKPKLFFKLIELYGVQFSDYQDCYEELKKIITNEDNKKNIEEKKEIKNKKEERDMDQRKRGSLDKSFINFNKKKNIYVPNKMRSSNANVYINQSELLNMTKEEKEINKNKENNKTRNIISINKNHLSIDCSKNAYKSNDTLPLININTSGVNKSGEKKIPNQKMSKVDKFLLSLEKEEVKQGKNKSSNKLEEVNIMNNIRLVEKKGLTSTKLPKINLDEIASNKAYKVEHHKDGEKTRKHYKLKATNNNFEKK